MPMMPAQGPSGGPPPRLAAVDAIDDAETRMIDTRRRDATPTVKEIPLGALVKDMDPTVPTAQGAHAAGEVDLLGASRRRAVITLVAVLVALAIAAFVIAGLILSGGGKEHGSPAPGASGDALDAPAIKVPVKKQP
jgi:hypothetical protein